MDGGILEGGAILECAIIFSHYRDDEVTRRHYELLRRNPYPVIATHNRKPRHLPHAIDVYQPDECSLEDNWEGPDTQIYRWFKHRGFDAERYIYIESDTYCSMPIKEFYAPVWDADCAGREVMRMPDPEWRWFQHIPRLGELAPFACGIRPFNGVILSHLALTAICKLRIPPHVFAELRIATLAAAAGFPPVAWPPSMARTNSWWTGGIHFQPDVPGLYHPVKQ